MTMDPHLARYLTGNPIIAMGVYVALVLAFLIAAWIAVADLGERRAAVGAAAEMLAQIEGRLPSAAKDTTSPIGSVPPGSAFLEGQTVTVAGAALLQRMAGAITRVGGDVLSSQVSLEGSRPNDGSVSVIASCEIGQSALQQLLYDLEAGMPFLFIDQLVVQAPASSSENGRLRILLGVSGQWGGSK
jgi:general secretion pathway protein M